MSMSSIPKSTAVLPQNIIEASPDFREKFNQASFQFSHNLTKHPLFQIPRLVELANFVAAKDRGKVICLTAGQIPIDCKWSDRIHKDRFAEALARIEESNTLVLINDAQLDPEYQALLDQIVIELEELTGAPLRQEITWVDAYIFITSPNSVTNYHIDHESNFLFQIHGEKEVNLFDQNDRTILTDQELEDFYTGNIQAAIYKPEQQSKASVYHLTPGQGVHHPVNAPHWVKTGDRFSITLSVLFYMRPFDLKARTYQINYILRKLRLKSTPPGQSILLDNIKINLVELFSQRKPKKKYDVVRSGINRILAPLKFSSRIARSLRNLPVTLLSSLPIVSDYYRYHWCFSRNITACRGVFGTFAEATQSLPPSSRISHDQADIHEHSAVSELTSCRTLGNLDSVDYPLLPWLKVALADSTTVFDFGGNVGVSYYAFQKHLHYPDSLRWVVCELPEIVKAGQKIACETDSRGLSFTTEFSEADSADILLTCGTLQYLEPSLAELLSQLHTKPKHLLVNHVPFYDGDSFITLQNIGYAYSPYKIQNRAEFLASLIALGYELIDSWEWNRTCLIPFHPEHFVKTYDGFYLRLRSV
jgi:putative methyltransferase (TIGR04325 family)